MHMTDSLCFTARNSYNIVKQLYFKKLIQNNKNENNRINENKIKSHRPKMTSENLGLKTYRYYLQNTLKNEAKKFNRDLFIFL